MVENPVFKSLTFRTGFTISLHIPYLRNILYNILSICVYQQQNQDIVCALALCVVMLLSVFFLVCWDWDFIIHRVGRLLMFFFSSYFFRMHVECMHNFSKYLVCTMHIYI